MVIFQNNFPEAGHQYMKFGFSVQQRILLEPPPSWSVSEELSSWLCFCSCPSAGLISPWNLPLYLLTWKIAPAIAAGNTVIAKPSELTSVTAWMLCKLLDKAGNRVWGQGGGTELEQNCQRPPSLSTDSVLSFHFVSLILSDHAFIHSGSLLCLPSLFNSSRVSLDNSVTPWGEGCVVNTAGFERPDNIKDITLSSYYHQQSLKI